MGTERQRLAIISWVQNVFIHANLKKLGIDRKKMLSEICLKFGVTQRKASEYIKVLLDAQFIEEDSLGLWLKEKPIEETEIKEIDNILKNESV